MVEEGDRVVTPGYQPGLDVSEIISPKPTILSPPEPTQPPTSSSAPSPRPQVTPGFQAGQSIGEIVSPPPTVLSPPPKPTPPPQEEYVYEVPVHETEQVQALRAFATERGGYVTGVREEQRPIPAPVRRVPGTPVPVPTVEGRRFMVTMRFRKELPEGVQPEVPTVSAISRRRREITEKAVSEEAFAKATPVEKGLLTGYTILSPKGEKYLGAVFTGNTEEVVKEQLRETYKEPFRPGVVGFGTDVLRGAYESLQSPVVQAELAFLGGAGFAKVGATRLGGKVLGSPIARRGLQIMGGSFILGKGGKAAMDIYGGRTEEGIGGLITTGAILGGAYAGARVQTSYIAKAPKEVTIDVTRVRGGSITAKGEKVSYSRGVFEAETPKIKGIRGHVKGKATVMGGKEGKVWTETATYIPKQKIGKIEIEPSSDISYGVATKFGKPVPGKLETVRIRTSSGKIDVGDTRFLVGEAKGDVFVSKLFTRDYKPFTDTTKSVILPEFSVPEGPGTLKVTGYAFRGVGKTPAERGLAVVAGKRIGIESTPPGAGRMIMARSGTGAVEFAGGRWVDVSKTLPTTSVPKPDIPTRLISGPETITFKDFYSQPPTPTIPSITIKGPPAEIAKVAPGLAPSKPPVTTVKKPAVTGAVISGSTAGQTIGAKGAKETMKIPIIQKRMSKEEEIFKTYVKLSPTESTGIKSQTEYMRQFKSPYPEQKQAQKYKSEYDRINDQISKEMQLQTQTQQQSQKQRQKQRQKQKQEQTQTQQQSQKQRQKQKQEQIQQTKPITGLRINQSQKQLQKIIQIQTPIETPIPTEIQRQKVRQKLLQKTPRPTPPITARLRMTPRPPPIPKPPMIYLPLEPKFGKISKRDVKAWGYSVKIKPVVSPKEMLKGF